MDPDVKKVLENQTAAITTLADALEAVSLSIDGAVDVDRASLAVAIRARAREAVKLLDAAMDA